MKDPSSSVTEALDTHLAALGITPESEPLRPENGTPSLVVPDKQDTDICTPPLPLELSNYLNYRPDHQRVFYHAGGHFHGDYSAVDVDFRKKTVTILWAAGLTRILKGADAFRFLKLNRSRHAAHFEPVNQSRKRV